VKSSSTSVQASAAPEAVETVDNYGAREATEGLSVTAEGNTKEAEWRAMLTCGLLAVKNEEADLTKLTLSFDHSIPANRAPDRGAYQR
jgi:hypothetical protein